MHGYIIEGKGRGKTQVFIAFGAIILTPYINDALSPISERIGNFIGFTYAFTPIALFLIFFWLFNNFIWRFSSKLFGVPNLNGEWNCKGQSFNIIHKNEISWESTIEIKQTWTKIGIYQHAKNSDSYSVSISSNIKTEANGDIIISYVYENTPRNNTPQLTKHKGLVVLRFNNDITKASGDYFNDQNRCTYGTMELGK